MLQKISVGFHVTLLGREVTLASSARDLGLQVDSTLSFDEHITNTVSSCLGSLCQINWVRHLLGTRARLHKTSVTTTSIRTCTRNVSELH